MGGLATPPTQPASVAMSGTFDFDEMERVEQERKREIQDAAGIILASVPSPAEPAPVTQEPL